MAAPPRSEQSQQSLHAFARCPRVQGAPVTRMEIYGVAGLPMMGDDRSLGRHDSILLISLAAQGGSFVH